VEAGSGSSNDRCPGPVRGLGDDPASCVGLAMNNHKMVPPARPNKLVRSPLLILRVTDDAWIGRFDGTQAELVLGYPAKSSLYQVVSACRQRFPNARIAFEEVILEDCM